MSLSYSILSPGSRFWLSDSKANTDVFLYAGGYGGPVRYGGKRFERIKGIDNAVTLFVAEDGCL